MTAPAAPHPPASVAVIGGGPAGLMAADVLAQAGVAVDLYDAMPSVGRKFLLAGRGGLNLTHVDPRPAFDARYGARAAQVAHWLDTFDGPAVRAWARALGIETFVGTSGRVFPSDLKAAPLLRAWLHRLRAGGVRLHARHRWTGFGAPRGSPDGAIALRFATPDGPREGSAARVVLALGGASWARLGSDGAWVAPLRAAGVDVAALQPANCGFVVASPRADAPDGSGWSAPLRTRFAGQPLKNVAFLPATSGAQAGVGECVLTEDGLEGSLVYAWSGAWRDALATGPLTVHLDLLPARDPARVLREVTHPRGARSWASLLASRLGLDPLRTALLRECAPAAAFDDPPALAALLKALPIPLRAPRPIDRAISSAGGVRFDAIDASGAIHGLPGVWCAGEMVDWEAPTGGYLLTACLASGVVAGRAVAASLGGADRAA